MIARSESSHLTDTGRDAAAASGERCDQRVIGEPRAAAAVDGSAMQRAILALAVVAAVAAPARADNDLHNFLIGPVFGVRLSGPSGDVGVIGIEGGVGWGPERFNLGFVHRAGRELYYVEIDPWLYLGGSFGFGVDSEGEGHGIIGVWEGLPIAGDFLHRCPRGYASAVTVAAGLRFTGVLELYATVKAGVSQAICF